MCMTQKELEKLGDTELVNNLIRSVQLDSEKSGNGKTPFDTNQLKKEVLRRMENFPNKVQRLKEENRHNKSEVGDGHDEFS